MIKNHQNPIKYPEFADKKRGFDHVAALLSAARYKRTVQKRGNTGIRTKLLTLRVVEGPLSNGMTWAEACPRAYKSARRAGDKLIPTASLR